MGTRNVSLVAIAAASLIGALALWSPAVRSQINASPNWIPIGVSASGSSSTVWFHEPSSRQTLACHTVGSDSAGITRVQCVAGRLP